MGDPEGPPLVYNWAVTGVASPLLPWLAILALLAFKPNRGWSAWWIWLPLAVLAAACHWLEPALKDPRSGLPDGVLEILLNIPAALAFGLAALWLLASHLRRSHRLGTCFATLIVLAGFTLFTFSAVAGWGLGRESILGLLVPRQAGATAVTGQFGLPVFALPVLLALGIAATLALCGLACRRRQRTWWFCLWLFLSLPAVWIAMSALLNWWFAGSADRFPLIAYVMIGLFLAAVSFATWLPFLVLSWSNALFRERLKALLHLKPQKSLTLQAERDTL